MSPPSPKPRRFSIPLWLWTGVVSVALVLVLVGPQFFFVATKEFKKREFVRKVGAGNEVVKAIYEYQGDNGLWPQALADLVPTYMPALPADPWSYVWPGYADDSPPLLKLADPLDMRMTYTFGCRKFP